MTSMLWMDYPVKTILHTALKDAVKRMIISASNSLHQVHSIIIHKEIMEILCFILLLIRNEAMMSR